MPISLRLIVLLLVGLGVVGCDRQKADVPQASVAGEVGKGVDRSHKGEAAPGADFLSPDGKKISVAALRGSPVLVNLWASWCGPCIKELPTLEALHKEQKGKVRLAIMAVSQDQGPQSSVHAFLKSKGIGRFAAFHDPEMALTGALDVQVMPTTILYDAAGKEVWRFIGDLDWTGAEARALIAEVDLAAAR